MTAVPADPRRTSRLKDAQARGYRAAVALSLFDVIVVVVDAARLTEADRDVLRTMACGIAGLSHAADSLSAMKYAKVKPVRDERGLMVDFKVDGEFPYYGNNDDRADDIAKMLVSMMMNKIRSYPSDRQSTDG